MQRPCMCQCHAYNLCPIQHPEQDLTDNADTLEFVVQKNHAIHTIENSKQNQAIDTIEDQAKI